MFHVIFDIQVVSSIMGVVGLHGMVVSVVGAIIELVVVDY